VKRDGIRTLETDAPDFLKRVKEERGKRKGSEVYCSGEEKNL